MEFELIVTNKCNLNCKQCYTIHGNEEMSDEVLNKAVDYIHRQISTLPDEEHEVNIVGGEAGLINHKRLNDIYDKVTVYGNIKQLHVMCRSNLAFELTDEFIKFAKRCTQVGTSYDYKARFGSQKQEELWRKNVKILQNEGIDLDCIITINKMLMTLTPEQIFDMVEELGFERFDLHRLFYPNQMKDEDKSLYDQLMRPKNRDVDKWLFQVYKEYIKRKKLNPKLSLETLDVVKDSIEGSTGEYTHARNCQKQNRTILPNGMVSQCTYTVFKPFYNLITGENNEEIYNSLVKYEEELHEECKKCPFLRYCKGDCCWFPHDDTGCPGLKYLYQYLTLMD